MMEQLRVVVIDEDDNNRLGPFVPRSEGLLRCGNSYLILLT